MFAQPETPPQTISTSSATRPASTPEISSVCNRAVPDAHLTHLSPIGWEHVNLTGDYIWGNAQKSTKTPVGLRPLRPIPDTVSRAA